ncbi:MAG: hypothetical protein JW789_05355 [Candidatus Aenigmarchaeota archaeon]|nr:hypothetical protein [Candidatus Aenigmarchaeota archaeon]
MPIILMKHTMHVTLILIAVFLFIQLFGLYAFSETMNVVTDAGGNTQVQYDETVVGDRPEISGFASLLYILFGVLVGTGIVMLFVRFGQFRLWKGMYFMAIWLASSVTLGVFMGSAVAMAIALILAVLELFRTNIYIHNLTEVFIYPGIAILFAPLFNLFWVSVLLVIISVYDMFAVWKSGHMIKLAKFQTSSKAFAGFVIPYGKEKIHKAIPKGTSGKGGMRTAILGGGDIAFPLLFAGVVMEWLVTGAGLIKSVALAQSLLVSLMAAVALFILFMKAEKDKFYPAMPFISAGCFAGLGLIWLLSLL